MQKPLIVPLALVFLLTGCSAFKKSQTWQQVVDDRSDRIASGTGKSSYTDRLHASLDAKNIEHKIVTYQFRYRTRLREEAVGTATAVIYRDPATPQSPWWVADENTAFPVWVPDEAPDRQLSFFLRRNAEVLAQRDYPAGGGGKTFDTAPAIAGPSSTPAMLATARKPARTQRNRTNVADVAVAAPVPPDSRLDEVFRTTHGTKFDPHSSADRQKMVELRQSFVAQSGEI